jgi:hypothetical protein
MENINILLWAMGSGFTLIFGLLLVVWNSLVSRIEKLDEKLTDVDRRLCRNVRSMEVSARNLFQQACQEAVI